MKCNGNASTLMSPNTPASSSILLQTRVRLGTQMTETSCSILLICWSLLICPGTEGMSARNDGAEPMVRKENAIDHAESISHLGIKTDQVELKRVYTIYFLSRFVAGLLQSHSCNAFRRNTIQRRNN